VEKSPLKGLRRSFELEQAHRGRPGLKAGAEENKAAEAGSLFSPFSGLIVI
jgi:hypothetical protein